jgi:hypothetical protein
MQLAMAEPQALEQVGHGKLVILHNIDVGISPRPGIGEGQHSQGENQAEGGPFGDVGWILLFRIIAQGDIHLERQVPTVRTGLYHWLSDPEIDQSGGFQPLEAGASVDCIHVSQ